MKVDRETRATSEAFVSTLVMLGVGWFHRQAPARSTPNDSRNTHVRLAGGSGTADRRGCEERSVSPSTACELRK